MQLAAQGVGPTYSTVKRSQTHEAQIYFSGGHREMTPLLALQLRIEVSYMKIRSSPFPAVSTLPIFYL